MSLTESTRANVVSSTSNLTASKASKFNPTKSAMEGNKRKNASSIVSTLSAHKNKTLSKGDGKDKGTRKGKGPNLYNTFDTNVLFIQQKKCVWIKKDLIKVARQKILKLGLS